MNMRIAGLAALLTSLALPALAAEREMTVHKDPNCGCCTAWAELAERAGYEVEVIATPDMTAIKEKAGIPSELWSCHTTSIDGYVIEGHVPFDAVARLLETRPDISGIAAPGMPAGSPGMGDDPAAQFDVISWGGEAGPGQIFQQVGAR